VATTNLTSTQSTVTPAAARWGRWWERNLRYLFVLPSVVMILGIGIFPLLYSVGISFLQWDLQRPERRFIWLKNYSTALSDNRLWEALGHTAIIIVAAVTLELLLGLLLAYTLTGPLPGRQLFITLFILPVVMAPLIVGYTWRMLWDTQYGPINQVLGWFTGQSVEIVWLANPRTVYPAILVTELWQWTPFMFLVLLAGLVAVDPQLREAAALDGASAWQTFAHVTLPLVQPIIVIAVLFRALDVFKLFDIIFSLTGGGPGSQTETVSFYIYQLGFKNFRLGYTAAVSLLVLVLVSVLITLLWRRLGEREGDNG
jgi:multiple sugar transport system permease protein